MMHILLLAIAFVIERIVCVSVFVHVRKFKIEIACYNQYEYRTIVLNGGRVFLSEPGTKREPRAHICSSSCEACAGICYAVRVLITTTTKNTQTSAFDGFASTPSGRLSYLRCDACRTALRILRTKTTTTTTSHSTRQQQNTHTHARQLRAQGRRLTCCVVVCVMKKRAACERTRNWAT